MRRVFYCLFIGGRLLRLKTYKSALALQSPALLSMHYRRHDRPPCAILGAVKRARPLPPNCTRAPARPCARVRARAYDPPVTILF